MVMQMTHHLQAWGACTAAWHAQGLMAAHQYWAACAGSDGCSLSWQAACVRSNGCPGSPPTWKKVRDSAEPERTALRLTAVEGESGSAARMVSASTQ